MNLHVRWRLLAIVTTVASLGVANPSSAQVAPAALVNLDAREIDVLREIMSQQWQNYKESNGRVCLDPTVAVYRASAPAPQERWSTEVLSAIARDVRFSLDTLTTALPRGMRGCTRSQTTWRLSYGRPRVYPDSAAMVFIATRLDARGQVDSAKVDFRIDRRAGKWRVDGWLADTETVHRYVKGEGCYRLWYAPLDTSPSNRLPIDTMQIRAESIFVGESWRSLPAYRLSPEPRSRGVAAQRGWNSIWYVTHDSVHFEWSRMNEDIYAVLHVVGDSLLGTMHSESDAIVPNPPTTSISGRRIRCASP